MLTLIFRFGYLQRVIILRKTHNTCSLPYRLADIFPISCRLNSKKRYGPVSLNSYFPSGINILNLKNQMAMDKSNLILKFDPDLSTLANEKRYDLNKTKSD